jgi:hypothetical protein
VSFYCCVDAGIDHVPKNLAEIKSFHRHFAKPPMEFFEQLSYVFVTFSTIGCLLCSHSNRNSSNRTINHSRTAFMKDICVSLFQSKVQRQITAFLNVTTHLVRRYGVRIQAGARKYYFFAKTYNRFCGLPCMFNAN